jgi:hypothetical protein
VYVALSALLSACACSFVLFAGGNYCCFSLWGADDDFRAGQHQQHPPRPQRRRLTREQVKRAIPQWFFDGDDEPLRPVRRVSVAAAAGGEDGGNASLGGGAGLEGGGAADEPLLPVPPPRPVELSLCSICLDDYEPGDKLRVLQCNHAFHGKVRTPLARARQERTGRAGLGPICSCLLDPRLFVLAESHTRSPNFAAPSLVRPRPAPARSALASGSSSGPRRARCARRRSGPTTTRKKEK